MDSIWTEIKRPTFDTLRTDKSTDVLIIGGGIAGLLCAHKLKRAGIDCLLVEADEICNGVTQNTTAKLTVGHGLIYDGLVKRLGEDRARLYLRAQRNALGEYSRLARDIDCDLEVCDNYVYSLDNAEKIEREAAALNRLGQKADLTRETELPFSVAAAVRVGNQARFHPLKFLYAVAADLPIYEHSKVINLAPGVATLNRCKIKFKRLIIATHFPMLNKHGGYFLKLYQHRSYVIALKNAQTLNGMYIEGSDTGLSFRPYGDLLLLGGGGHRTGKKGGCWQELEKFANEYYKGAEIVGKWATQDCMTLDGVPYIGRYARNTPDVYVATGFNKWGMTNAMVAADILTDLISGKESEYTSVFSPSRSILRKQLAINALESTIGLLTPTAPRCPHLGCALKYNKEEHSWDCPCHGSRFTEDGELIDNPATDDKKMR